MGAWMKVDMECRQVVVKCPLAFDTIICLLAPVFTLFILPTIQRRLKMISSIKSII